MLVTSVSPWIEHLQTHLCLREAKHAQGIGETDRQWGQGKKRGKEQWRKRSLQKASDQMERLERVSEREKLTEQGG